MRSNSGDGLWPGNRLTLEELTEIEEQAHRSQTKEAETILRISAALREAMQVRENALALLATTGVQRTGKT